MSDKNKLLALMKLYGERLVTDENIKEIELTFNGWLYSFKDYLVKYLDELHGDLTFSLHKLPHYTKRGVFIIPQVEHEGIEDKKVKDFLLTYLSDKNGYGYYTRWEDLMKSIKTGEIDFVCLNEKELSADES